LYIKDACTQAYSSTENNKSSSSSQLHVRQVIMGPGMVITWCMWANAFRMGGMWVRDGFLQTQNVH